MIAVYMEKNLFIPVILGTNREGRNSQNVAKLLVQEMENREDIKTQLFDVRDFAFPQDNYGQSIKDKFPEWQDAIIKADGLVIVTPEYNHGYPGVLKTLLDTLYDEYARKPVGLASVSMGLLGGARAIEGLLPVVRELGLVPAHIDLRFPRVQELFDEQGNLKDKTYKEQISRFLDELEWMAQALRWGRENLTRKHA
jgi:NAD(P)H-dependent FMN reductase